MGHFGPIPFGTLGHFGPISFHSGHFWPISGVGRFGPLYYPLAHQSCGGDIGSVPYVCM